MAKAANVITCSRIPVSIALLFFPPFSVPFYVLYLVTGISDMIDGAVARATDTVGESGARLDTVADLVLVAVCLIKLLPVMRIPGWIRVWIGMIALIKIINYISGYVVHKRFVALHTVMNKVTGALLFLLPLTVSFLDMKYTAAAVCAVATFAAIQEGHFIRTASRRNDLRGMSYDKKTDNRENTAAQTGR